MEVLELFFIGVALAMDAFGVSLSVGVTYGIKRKQKILYIISFGFFQFLMIFLGGAMGHYVNTYLIPVSNTFGGMAVGIIGLFMIILDALKQKDRSYSILVLLSMFVFVIGFIISIVNYNSFKKTSDISN